MASSTTSLLQLENSFAEFYYRTIPVMYDLKNRQFLNNVKSSLKDIRQLKKDINMKDQKLFFADVHYNVTAVRCAYVYAYSVLHTIVVHSHFSSYMKECQSILTKLSFDQKIQICCLGGGPGTEAVAICKVFNDFIADNTECRTPLNISITVIDICAKWKDEFFSIIETVNKYSSLFDSKKINVKAEFIEADLLKPFSGTVQNKIKEAAIVTMIKLASAINEKTPEETNETLRNLLKDVRNCMTQNSYLFFLDKAGGTMFSKMTKILYKGPVSGEKTILLHKVYRLDIKTLLKSEKLINSEKNTKSVITAPTRMTTVSSCFWRKPGSELIRKEDVKNACVSSKNDAKMLKEAKECDHFDASANCAPVVLIGRREIDIE